MKTTYLYSAVFIYEKSGIFIVFPDFDDCVAFGDDEQQALINARSTLSMRLLSMEENGEKLPEPTKISEVVLEQKQKAVLVDVFMPTVREKMRNRLVKKTVTIPNWLYLEAERFGLDCSQVLKDALKKQLNL